MFAGSLASSLMEAAPLVYGAALAAGRDETMAAGVTERLMGDETRDALLSGARSDERVLVARTVQLAVKVAPAYAFRAMHPEDREAVALARLAGSSVTEIAELLEIDVATVKARMLRGLQTVAAALSGGDAQRTPLPPSVCETRRVDSLRAGHSACPASFASQLPNR